MRIGVLLNGCGHRDGSEIHEAVFTMAALEEQGWQVACFSIDAPQTAVANHVNGQPVAESRNMLVEAARIARGRIKALGEARLEDLDALAIPGGFGSARNLCNFADKGAAMEVRPEVADIIRGMYEAKKPIMAVCIAPVIVAKVLGPQGVSVTVGQDSEVAHAIEAMGARHLVCESGSCVVDDVHRVVTSPAYMYGDARMPEVWSGIRQAAAALKQWLA